MNEQQHFEQNDPCLDRGLFVALRDDELSTSERVQAQTHLLQCADCSADEREVRATGEEVYSLFATLKPAAVPDTRQAFAALQAKINDERRTTDLNIVALSGKQAQRSFRSAQKHMRLRWAMIAVAAALIAAILLPNAGVLANQFLSLFHVQKFQPVQIDADQVTQSLYKNLNNFGNVHVAMANTDVPTHPTRAQVEQYIHFPLLTPSVLPSGVANTPQYHIFAGTRGTFTFDAAKARAAMRQMGDGNVRLPAQLNGAVYTITVAPGVAIQYARACQSDDAACRNQKQLGLVEVPSPMVQGTNANALNDIRAFMLALPHLSPDVRDLWQSVDIQSGTIPLPLPTAQTNVARVSIQGVSGVLMVDSSIKYGGVIWQKNNIVYAILTNTSEGASILATANSLR